VNFIDEKFEKKKKADKRIIFSKKGGWSNKGGNKDSLSGGGWNLRNAGGTDSNKSGGWGPIMDKNKSLNMNHFGGKWPYSVWDNLKLNWINIIWYLYF
jgi:hypothetical protein